MSTASPASFQLLETMRLEGGTVIRLERHLQRLTAAAQHFDYALDARRVRNAITNAAENHLTGVWRMRLTVSADGAPAVAVSVHQDTPAALWHVAFANAPVDDTDPLLRHKTTHRAVYDTARRGRPDVDDVLLWNTRRELTESTIANVVVEIDGRRCTPPVGCGLLPGVLRAELLERGDIVERVITRGEVVRAERIWLINSLRGWIEARLVR